MKNNLTILQLFKNLHLTDNFKYLTTTLKGISGIYCVRCTVTGAMYIGSAVDLAKRAAEHLFYSKTNEHLQRAITKHGLEHFEFIVVEFCDLDSLLEREQYYLDWLFSLSPELRYNFLPTAGSPVVICK
jgi:group I intron endonuclease